MSHIAAVALAVALSWTAHKLNWLDTRGAIAAGVIGGTIFIGGGLSGAILLAVFFVPSSALTKFAERHRPETCDHERGGRGAGQVIANGAWAALGAALLPAGDVGWPILAGALAAAQADTWATEVGAFSRSPPRLMTSLAVVTPGTSGGVTVLGTAGGVAGAALMAITAALLGIPVTAAAIIGGGTAGTLADSLLGATVQGSYFCEGCQVVIERARHTCGHSATLRRGAMWIDNDVVNFLATGFGSGVSLGLSYLF